MYHPTAVLVTNRTRYLRWIEKCNVLDLESVGPYAYHNYRDTILIAELLSKEFSVETHDLALTRNHPHYELAILHEGLKDAAEFEACALASGTKSAYRRAFSIFSEWCSRKGINSLPCTSRTLESFLGEQARRGLSPSRLGILCASVRMAHRLHEPPCPDPTDDEKIRMLLRGVRRLPGRETKPRRPLMSTRPRATDDLSDLQRVIACIPDTLVGLRDRALILLGYAGAMRRSEIVALEIRDLEITERGLIVTIRRSKGDQVGAGQQLMIPPGKNQDTCAISAISSWLRAAQLVEPESRVFRSIGRGGRIHDSLCSYAVALIVKSRLKGAGIDPEQYAAHSLRSGFLTSAADSGSNIWQLLNISRHKDAKTLQKYVRRSENFETYAGRGIL